VPATDRFASALGAGVSEWQSACDSTVHLAPYSPISVNTLTIKCHSLALSLRNIPRTHDLYKTSVFIHRICSPISDTSYYPVNAGYPEPCLPHSPGPLNPLLHSISMPYPNHCTRTQCASRHKYSDSCPSVHRHPRRFHSAYSAYRRYRQHKGLCRCVRRQRERRSHIE